MSLQLCIFLVWVTKSLPTAAAISLGLRTWIDVNWEFIGEPDWETNIFLASLADLISMVQLGRIDVFSKLLAFGYVCSGQETVSSLSFPSQQHHGLWTPVG